ncbi:MAG: hypothetical protein ACJ8AJ_11775 [Gemmatimonadaceae bacterium]
MIVRTHVRMLLPLMIASLVGCFGGAPDFRRNGPDLIVTGATAVYDSVPGDVILAGGDFEFAVPASTGGDYLGAAGNQNIRGRIHGSLRAAGGEIHLRGSVDRNATIAGGNVELDSSSVIGGNVYIAGGNLALHGNVRGGVLARAGNVDVNGTIGRDVDVSGGALHIGARTQIAGNLRYRVPKDKVKIDSGARITGTITALPVSTRPGIRQILWVLGFFVAGLVVVALLPGFTTQTADILAQRPLWSALVAIATMILIFCAIIIAGITFVGLPLAVVILGFYVGVLLLSEVPFALWLGRLVLGARARAGTQGAVLNFVVGGLILLLVQVLPVIGGIVMAIAGVTGLGAIMLRAYAMRRAQPV